jgi:hypothetical protein
VVDETWLIEVYWITRSLLLWQLVWKELYGYGFIRRVFGKYS